MILDDFTQLLKGVGGNTLLARRLFYDEISYVDDALNKIVIGDYGTGKTVAARWVVNNSSTENQYAIHLPLRNLDLASNMPQNISDRHIGSIISYVLKPKQNGNTYANYEEIGEITANDEASYFIELAKKLREMRKTLMILLDEVDMPATTGGFIEVLNSRERLADFLFKLMLYMRYAYDKVGGPYINLVVFGARDVMKHVEQIISDKTSGGLDYLRMRKINIPKNMSYVEYKDFFEKLCNYFNFKCNVNELAKELSKIDAPLWVPINAVKNAVSDLLRTSNCADLECVKSKNLELKLYKEIEISRIYRILENTSWSNNVKRVINEPELVSKVEKVIIEGVVEKIKEARGWSIHERKIHPRVSLYVLDSPQGRRIGLLVRLIGGPIKFGVTVMQTIGNVLIEPKAGEGKRRTQKAAANMLYVIKHSTVDTRNLRGAMNSRDIEVHEKIMPKDALYAAILEVVGYSYDVRALSEFIEEVSSEILELGKSSQ